MALLIVVLSVALGVGISRFDFIARIPVVGPFLFKEQPARTTTSPVVVEGIRELNQLATVRLTGSALITRRAVGPGSSASSPASASCSWPSGRSKPE
jgi:hypothetical protein